MRRNLSSNLLCFLLAMTVSMGLASCAIKNDIPYPGQAPDKNGGSNNSGGNSGGGSTLTPTLTDSNGQSYQLTSLENPNSGDLPLHYNYDAAGRLTSYGGADFEATVSGNTVSIRGFDHGVEYYQQKYVLTTNAKGSITHCTFTYTANDSEGSENGSGEANFTYNAANQLASLAWSTRINWAEDGMSGVYNYALNMTLTWENGNLTKTEYDITEQEYGESESHHGSRTLTYGEQVNVSKQMPARFIKLLSEGEFLDMLYYLAPLGLFGVGPTYLPTAINESPISFELNPNGTIHTETEHSYITTYGYGN